MMTKLLSLLKRIWPILLLPGIILIWHFVINVATGSPEGIPAEMTEAPQASYVLRVQTGWRTGDLEARQSGLPWSTPVVTVVLRNFDDWVLRKALGDQALLSESNLTTAEIKAILDGTAETGDPNDPESPAARRKLKLDQWFRRQLSALRLNIAGSLFETIAPIDPLRTASPRGKDSFSRLVYVLNPKDTDVAEWNSLIKLYGSEYAGPISVSLMAGEKKFYHLDTQVNSEGAAYPQAYFLPLRPRMVRALAWAGLFAVLGLMLAVSIRTGALRTPLEGTQTDWRTSQWSISRVVLAWWLTLCTACYIFLWSMTGEYNVLSKTALVLLGINGATLLAATSMSRSLSPDKAVGAAPWTPQPTRGFLTDLISEGGDAEISRVQMLVWNVVLGLIFIWETLADWKMPEFDTVQLTLLGISSTAYVGFKLVPPAPKAPPTPPPAGGGGAG